MDRPSHYLDISVRAIDRVPIASRLRFGIAATVAFLAVYAASNCGETRECKTVMVGGDVTTPYDVAEKAFSDRNPDDVEIMMDTDDYIKTGQLPPGPVRVCASK